MTRLRRDQRGVTVPELLIVVAVFTLILVASLGVLQAATRTERGQQSRSDALDGVRIAMARVTKDLRQAISVDPSSDATRLKMVTIVDGATSAVIYDVVDGVLRRQVDSASPSPVVERVLTSASLPFCYDPPTCTGVSPAQTPPSVMVVIELEPDVSDAPPIKLATTIKLRNA